MERSGDRHGFAMTAGLLIALARPELVGEGQAVAVRAEQARWPEAVVLRRCVKDMGYARWRDGRGDHPRDGRARRAR